MYSFVSNTNSGNLSILVVHLLSIQVQKSYNFLRIGHPKFETFSNLYKRYHYKPFIFDSVTTFLVVISPCTAYIIHVFCCVFQLGYCKYKHR